MAALQMIGPGPAASWWSAWGCVAQVAVTDRAALRSARRLVQRELADTERAAYRYRPDAEIHKLYRAGGRPVAISPLLADLVSAALLSAERTGGDVDPTVAAAVTRLDVDASTRRQLQAVPSCGRGAGGPARQVRRVREVREVRPVPGWLSVRLEGRTLQLPPGVTLDLTATAKALSCDRAAARVADRLGTGVSVALGGNVATAGPAPDGDWTVHLDDNAADRHASVRLPSGAALATSALARLVDPRTGGPVGGSVGGAVGGTDAVWRSASAIGFSCLKAASYTTAALIRGPGARAWLVGLGVPGRLITVHGDEIEVAGWAEHTRHDAPTTPGSTPGTGDAAGVPAPRTAKPQRTTLR